MVRLLTILSLAISCGALAQDGPSAVPAASPADTAAGAAALNNATPAKTTDTEGVALLLGIGSRVGGPGITNYKTTSNNVLETTNLGRATPQALAGLGFAFCGSVPAVKDSKTGGFCGNRVGSRLGVFVSAQFGAGADQALTGFTIGGSIHISPVLHFLAGYSMTPINEPSPGFRNAASQYVLAHAAQYPGVDASAMAADKMNAFDGFQYVIPPPAGSSSPGNPVYAGDVLATHYRGGLFIGVAFPLTLKSELK